MYEALCWSVNPVVLEARLLTPVIQCVYNTSGVKCCQRVENVLRSCGVCTGVVEWRTIWPTMFAMSLRTTSGTTLLTRSVGLLSRHTVVD